MRYSRIARNVEYWNTGCLYNVYTISLFIGTGANIYTDIYNRQKNRILNLPNKLHTPDKQSNAEIEQVPVNDKYLLKVKYINARKTF